MVIRWLIPEFWSKNILLNTHSNENMRKRNENRKNSELIFQNFAKISGAPKNGGRIGELPSLRFCFVCEMLFRIAAIGCAFFFELNADLFDCRMHCAQVQFWKWRKCRLVEMAADSVSERFACFCLLVLAAHAAAILTPLCWLLCINWCRLFSILSLKTQVRSCEWALLRLLWFVRLVVCAAGFVR